MKKSLQTNQYTKLNQNLSIYGLSILLLSFVILLIYYLFSSDSNTPNSNSGFASPLVLMLSAGFLIGYLIDYNKYKKSKTKMNLYNAVSYMLLTGLFGLNLQLPILSSLVSGMNSDYNWLVATIVSLGLGFILLKSKNGADATSKTFKQIFVIVGLLTFVPLIINVIPLVFSQDYSGTDNMGLIASLVTNLILASLPIITYFSLRIKITLDRIYYAMYVAGIFLTLISILSYFALDFMVRLLSMNLTSESNNFNFALIYAIPVLTYVLFVAFIIRAKKLVKA